MDRQSAPERTPLEKLFMYVGGGAGVVAWLGVMSGQVSGITSVAFIVAFWAVVGFMYARREHVVPTAVLAVILTVVEVFFAFRH